MTTKYADRAFISINGAKLVDVQSASLKRTLNAKAVPTMTPDGFNRGYVQGNQDIDIQVEVAVENLLGRPKIEAINFETNDVALTFVCGADQWVATGLFLKDSEDRAGGVGEEVKTSFSFGALTCTSALGLGGLFDLKL